MLTSQIYDPFDLQLTIGAPPETEWPNDLIALTRNVIAMCRAHEPTTRASDSFVLAVIFVQARIEETVLTRGRTASFDEVKQCFVRSIELVTIADPQFAREAGAVPKIVVPHARFHEHVDAFWARWDSERLRLTNLALKRGSVEPNSREDRIIHLLMWIWDRRVVSRDVLMNQMRQASDGLDRRRDEESPPKQLDPIECMAEYLLACKKHGSPMAITCVEPDGRLSLSAHAVRDASRQNKRLERLSLDEQGAKNDPTSLADALPSSEEKSGTSELENRDERDTVTRHVEEFAKARAEESKPGSARQIVAENLRALLEGRLAQNDLASRHRLAEATISEALQEARIGLHAYLRRHGVQG